MPSSAAQQWLEKASEDLQVVSLVCSAKGPWSIAAYHVQQAAEKTIKAVLVDLGVAPPKSHDLAHLLSLFTKAPVPDAVLNAAAMTSAYAWLTRYPGAPPIVEKDVIEALTYHQIIDQWARGELS